MIRNFFQ